MLLRSLPAAAALLFFSAASPLSAITLDWDAISWTAGSLNNSYNIDPARAGNDITVGVVANGGAPFQSELVAPNPMTPAIAPAFQGGLATTQNSLCIALNLTTNTQSVTFNVSFSSLYTAGVTNLSFSLFDIDFSNASGNTYQDQLTSIRGIGIDGSLIAPTITTSSGNSVTGSGINQILTGTSSVVDTGAGSGNGNVMISFGNSALSGFTFTYGSGSAFANPTYQHIGIHDISYTPVPEMNPAWLTFLTLFATTGLVLRHRANSRTASLAQNMARVIRRKRMRGTTSSRHR